MRWMEERIAHERCKGAYAFKSLLDNAMAEARQISYNLMPSVLVDFGLVLYVRFGLNENVSASANYAIVGASSVSSTGFSMS